MLSGQARITELDIASSLYKSHQYEELLRVLRGIPEEKLLHEPELAFYFAVALFQRNAFDEAVAWATRTRSVCDVRGNTALRDRCWSLQAAIDTERGALFEAEEILRWLLGRPQVVAGASLHAANANNLGVIATIRCHWDGALASFSRALALCHEAGDHGRYALCQHNVAMAYRELGFYDAAENHFQYAYAQATEERIYSIQASVEFERALLLGLRGDNRLAVISANQALRRAREHRNELLEAEALRVLGVLAQRQDDREEARKYLERALELGERVGVRLVKAEVLEELAVLEMAELNVERSAERADVAARIYEAMGAAKRAERMNERLLLQQN